MYRKKESGSRLIELYQQVDIDSRFPNYAVYTYDKSNMEMMIDKFAEKGIPIQNSYEMGATIGTHVGAGCFGIICIGDRLF